MKINRSPRGGPHWVCLAPDFQRPDAKTLPSLTYVLLWMSMAQRQRITDDSSVQIPKVRAWRPFTVEQKKPRVSRGDSQGSLQTPLTSLVAHGRQAAEPELPSAGQRGGSGAAHGNEKEWKESHSENCAAPLRMSTVERGHSKSKNPTESPLRPYLLTVAVSTSVLKTTLVQGTSSPTGSGQVWGNVAHSGASGQDA